VFGFAALSTRLGANMGQPVSCEYADPNGSGDTLQDTTGGLAFWRKATNTPTFTDGSTHWALTTYGLIGWRGDSIDPPQMALRPAGAWLPPLRKAADHCVTIDGLPDAGCTPGAVDPAVSQDTIGQTICVTGYTARVRPPTSFTTPLKRTLMTAYGYGGLPLAGFELDHLIALELGGAPRDSANLWPTPWTGAVNARQKDVVENSLKAQVCRGTLSLAEAQRMIAVDWVSVYRSRAAQVPLVATD
jgi:hypothetical protein